MRKNKKFRIKEFANGTFQVWKGNEVLDPYSLCWKDESSAEHDWMFVTDKETAKLAIQQVVAKETVVAVHEVTVEVL